ncbi:hypothetical protein E3T26_06920 [Cryobacterium sp. TMT1-21]|uniref:hypothetical protein n=1 Tax=Cryobacterium sp. TMT1-21 TaxID=1259234 RepID=UPI00106C2F27|nr:hypothetical protein [Cryobacterium sp. TMT1-21]TFD15508.1 hypothetical protein E3T26_06920 [Cryobacterium sp. TMT1-21]
MTITELFEVKDALVARMDKSSANLAAACAPHRGDMGLLDDEFKRSDTYASLNNLYYLDKQLMADFWKSVRGNKEFIKADKERTLAKRYKVAS